MLVSPLPGNAFSVRSSNTNALVDLKTEAQLAFSDAVLSKVRPVAGGLDAVALRRRVSVSVVNNAEVIVISYRGDSSLEATKMARSVADAFLAVRTTNAVDAAVKRTDVVQSALDNTQHDFDVASAGTDPTALTVLGQRINALQRSLRAVSGKPPPAGSVLEASAPRSAQVRKLRVALVGTGVLLAAVIGMRLGRRPRHFPRWTKRVGLGRRFSLRAPQRARVR